MIFVNCLWVGVLAGLVGSRVLRADVNSPSTGSTIAVGVLGSLFGGLSQVRLLSGLGELPHVDIVAAGLGAATALALWAAAQRYCLNGPPRP